MTTASSRRRHLLDPDQLRRDYEQRLAQGGLTPGSTRDTRSLGRVQKWVISSFVLSTILQFAVAAVFFAYYYVEPADVSTRVGLNVIAAVVGIASVGAARAVHQVPIRSWWLLAGVLPGILGAWITFG